MKKYLVAFSMVFMFSCGQKKVIEKPANLIPEKEMSDILYDVAILNAAKAINTSILQEQEIDPMAYIYAKYEIDSLQFVKSDAYYASIPLIYENIYTSVETRLVEAQKVIDDEKLKKKEEDSNKSKESLKKATNK
ncbi:protein of unknown function [Arenibacter nanhaiticus]|uniref:DUF4296 domain-containing protein n=1 Tax=Arenibacter nanhaiticus TaxID=558155 RepID=A0A1M6JPB2_9FLAO|nr:DUF4296 domain-containing protein [Arenibacter nanhaiticus]SHJ48514.1 protein of unknown function [Arenibacter nanhaiticus]